MFLLSIIQTCAPKNTQRFKFGFGFEFSIFEYMSFEFEFEFDYFANLLQISKNVFKTKKKLLFE